MRGEVAVSQTYQTDDNKLFESEEEAKSHQRDLIFGDWYSNNKIQVAPLKGPMVQKWLKENRQIVMAYLEGIK